MVYNNNSPFLKIVGLVLVIAVVSLSDFRELLTSVYQSNKTTITSMLIQQAEIDSDPVLSIMIHAIEQLSCVVIKKIH